MSRRLSQMKFKPTPSSLAGKYALAFGIFVFFSFFSLGTLFWYLWRKSDDRILQASSVEVVYDMARQLQPLLRGEINPWAVQLLLDKIIATNPNLSPYLISEDGTFIELFSRANSFNERGQRIDIAPLHQYLNDTTRTSFPIYGATPGDLNTKSVFAVARLLIIKSSGYLCVILNPRTLQAMWMVYSLENMIRGLVIYGFVYAIIAWLLAISIFNFF